MGRIIARDRSDQENQAWLLIAVCPFIYLLNCTCCGHVVLVSTVIDDLIVVSKLASSNHLVKNTYLT